MKTLENSINSLFGNTLDAKKIDALVKNLQERDYVIIKQENVTYRNMQGA